MNKIDNIKKIIDSEITSQDKTRFLNDFAKGLEWKPSNFMVTEIDRLSNAHLVVEYGLVNSAVITFLKEEFNFNNLELVDKNNLLGISYNNLIDYHIFISSESIIYIYNRRDPFYEIETINLNEKNIEKLRSIAFSQIIGNRPSVLSLLNRRI